MHSYQSKELIENNLSISKFQEEERKPMDLSLYLIYQCAYLFQMFVPKLSCNVKVSEYRFSFVQLFMARLVNSDYHTSIFL